MYDSQPHGDDDEHDDDALRARVVCCIESNESNSTPSQSEGFLFIYTTIDTADWWPLHSLGM